MRKKLLSILVLSILIAIALAGCSHGSPSGKIAEAPPSSADLPAVESEVPTFPGPEESIPPEPEEPSLPSTNTPSTLTMLSITEGNVYVMKAGTDNWVEAEVGMTLEVGDIVKSGDNSNAEITFFDGSTIELQAGTQIEVASLDIAMDTGSTTIRLKQEIGNTISRVTKLVDPASRYEVETPAGVAAVRGSVMLVYVIEDGTTRITNQEGNIWAIAQGVELQIPEGRICIIRPGQPPRLISLGGYGGGGGSNRIVTDLAIDKSDSSDPVHPGTNLIYTLQITNNGPSDSTGAVVLDALPSGVSFISATDGGTYDSGSHTVSWAIGTLAKDANASVSITVKVNESTPPGIITNTATVDANERDNYSANNTATEDTTVSAVNDPPVAEDDTATTPEDTPVVIEVLVNDSDVDGDTLIVDSVTQGANGSVTNNGSDVTYTPDTNFNGTDSFTYTISDGNGGSDTATVTVTVNAVNDPPVAVDDSASTDEDNPVTVAAPGVLNNDSDPDVGDTLTVTAVDTSGTIGAITSWGADGSFTYDPNGQFEYLQAGGSTTDSFTYTVSDGNGGTDTATVTITINGVNDAPTDISLDNSIVAENQPSGTAVGNFSTTDPDAGDTHTYSLVSGDGDADNALFSIVGNQLQTAAVFDYEIKNSYSICVRATDSGALYHEEAFTITVTNVNDPPVAVDDSETTLEDSPVTIDVLANDSDADGDTLIVTSVTDPPNGTAVLEADNTVTYTPDTNFNGTDSFTYTISDGNGGSDTATVTVTVLRRMTMTLVSDETTRVIRGNTGSFPRFASEAWAPPNWSNIDYTFPAEAKWIWESYRTQNPVAGDIIDFEKTFTIPGTPISGTLHITCDNGYEVYVNGNGYPAGDPRAISAQLGTGWRTSNRGESFVHSDGWQSVESWDITDFLQSGSNTLDIGAANEHMGYLDGQSNGTQDTNPAGLIFEIVVTYVAE
jgi:uncharacterized repeat protein (TIGR01451 family)